MSTTKITIEHDGAQLVVREVGPKWEVSCRGTTMPDGRDFWRCDSRAEALREALGVLDDYMGGRDTAPAPQLSKE